MSVCEFTLASQLSTRDFDIRQFLGVVRPDDRIVEIDRIDDLEAVKMMRLRDICFF